jgi:hypothetical protein
MDQLFRLRCDSAPIATIFSIHECVDFSKLHFICNYRGITSELLSIFLSVLVNRHKQILENSFSHVACATIQNWLLEADWCIVMTCLLSQESNLGSRLI